eukprot:scaffold30755_cov62-Isochrysis_galbana.AAC.1
MTCPYSATIQSSATLASGSSTLRKKVPICRTEIDTGGQGVLFKATPRGAHPRCGKRCRSEGGT